MPKSSSGPSGRADKRFDPGQLDWTIVTRPLLKQIAFLRQRFEDDLAKAGKSAKKRKKAEDEREELLPVVIDLNFKYKHGLTGAKVQAMHLIEQAAKRLGKPKKARTDERKKKLSQQYLFAQLEADVIEELARLNFRAQEMGAKGAKRKPAQLENVPAEDVEEIGFIDRPVFMIWPDFEVHACTLKSISTVKADAAHRAFSARGEGVVWAVLDSGIDQSHVHFKEYKNLEIEKLDPPLRHKDFTEAYEDSDHAIERRNALTDDLGHGTHVAGIIAGEVRTKKPQLHISTRRRDEKGDVQQRGFDVDHMSGMAPECKLVSIKVLKDDGSGRMSDLLAAIAEIQEINEHGRWLKIHGVNLSVGYDFEPEWFACGQSPLCLEVDRLVKSGVVVVTAAGNTGYGFKQTTSRGAVASGMLMSINDPGNADLAITVGSTHREMPHNYGVSFFSSKGPTGDGRRKPDLVAPGERILSCAAGKKRQAITSGPKGRASRDYVEDSGTSMAAPHVSGVIAAFLSIRREFIGRPEKVKELFVANATDLKRESYMQGNGLVDLMRSIQAV